MAYEYEQTDHRISGAALLNKWDDVRELFEERPQLKFKPVNKRLETPLMIAVGTNRSHEFVKQLLNNVDHRYLRRDDEWCGMNIYGNNALHYAAEVGNMIDAKLMIQCLPRTMKWNKNSDGDTPFLLAAKLGREDMIVEVFIKMAYEYAETDLRIYNAALHNKWDDVCELFEERPQLKFKPVNKRLETPLMIAVGTNSSHEFVYQLLRNVRCLDYDELWGVNDRRNNALHYAVKVGNWTDATLMGQYLTASARIKNRDGDTPFLLAAKLGREDMIDGFYWGLSNVLYEEKNLIIPTNTNTNTVKMTYEYAETDLRIYKAALRNKWDDVGDLFIENPYLMIKPVNERLETPLMIAVGTNSSHEFVKQMLKNAGYLDHDELCGVNNSGNSALHYAAKVGNINDAELMVQRFPPTMITIKNIHGDTPFLLAAKLGRKDMIEVFRKLSNVRYKQSGEDDLMFSTIIQAGLLDLALEIACFNPPEEITTIANALEALATKPEFFPSGNRLGFWGGLVYRWMPTIGIYIQKEYRPYVDIYKTWEARLKKLRSACKHIKTWAPAIANILDIKIKNELGNATVILFCELIEEKDPFIASKVLGSSIAIAVKYGIYELIEECVLAHPSIIWSEFEEFNLFHLAIKERQVQVYNLVYHLFRHKAFHGEENVLHIAAKLAPSYRLSTITGAALQLQSELQWYQEVETFVKPEHVKALNKDGKTPWMVFTDEHKDLLKEGQQWMKDTATSCTVVAALIVTITFIAATIVPAGNKDDDGKLVFLNERAFMVFMISDAFALFSSSTSLLMFLRMLTSHYAEMDFLHALPMRLMIGLVSLFLSIAATMMAFGATLALLLHDNVTWIAAPVVMITSIPVGLYALPQFPLLIEIVWSTYGPSIFRKQISRLIL